MRILIDGDGFPNISEIVNLAEKYNVLVIIYVDTSHLIESSYAKVITVDKSDNSVDLFIQNEVKKNDLVLTQDYGVALISLFKGAKTINQYGYFYKDENIDYLMEIKNINRKNKKLKGPKKRSIEDKERLLNVVEKVIKEW